MNRKQEMIHDLKEDFVAKVFELAEEELSKEYFTQYLNSTLEIIPVQSGTKLKIGVRPRKGDYVAFLMVTVPHDTTKQVDFTWSHDYTRHTAWGVKLISKFFLMATDIATVVERINRDDLKL